MDRRSFILQGSMSAIALGILPTPAFAQSDEFSMEELMGKADIPLYGEGINLRKEAYEAFIEMRNAALKDGIDIKIVSSFRSFDRQVSIFERKFIKYTEDLEMKPLDAVD